MLKPTDKDHIIKTIEREAGGGCVKAVQLTIFFDSEGNLIGKAETKVEKLYPGGIERLLRMLFSAPLSLD